MDNLIWCIDGVFNLRVLCRVLVLFEWLFLKDWSARMQKPNLLEIKISSSALILPGLISRVAFSSAEEKKKLIREFDEKQREANETVSLSLELWPFWPAKMLIVLEWTISQVLL